MICLLLRYQVESFWEVDGLVARVLDGQLPVTNWQAMVETARAAMTSCATPKYVTEKEKQFFFEKKNQKTFAYRVTLVPRSVPKKTKSFLLLFFKKEVLFYHS